MYNIYYSTERRAKMETAKKLIDTFNKLEVSEDTEVTLVYSDAVDVFHYTGEAEETAVSETDTIERLVDAALSGINFNQSLVEDVRDQDHLEDYERGSFGFAEHIQEKIQENFYDYYDYIDFETRQYDHKRGRTNVSATLNTNVKTLVEHSDGTDLYCLSGWTAEFYTENGNISIEL